MIKKGKYVRIEKVIIKSSDRVSKIPDDTKATDFKIWTKGILINDCNIGEQCEITTMSGRVESGTLIEVSPQYELNFGKFIPELIEIDLRLKNE